MIRDYFRMKINDKVQTVGEEREQQEKEEEEERKACALTQDKCDVQTQGQRRNLHPTDSLSRSGNYSVPYIGEFHKLMASVINRKRCIY